MKKSVCELAFKFAAANKNKYPEKLNGEHTGGEEWMKLCLRKHRGVVERKPEVNRLH
jgi:hypothetical protein